jgi:glutathione S-transferase
MKLVGMLDSPFVRRVAVTMNFLRLPFEHANLSVFGDYDRFAAINPLVKAPTLVTDDGTVLVESGVIVAYLDGLVPEARRLGSASLNAARVIGLATAACEKAVQLVYERRLRPADKLLASWEARVIGQIGETYAAIEAALPAEGWCGGDRPMAPDIFLGVAWRFVQGKHPGLLAAGDHPKLERLWQAAEALPEFAASPYDEDG